MNERGELIGIEILEASSFIRDSILESPQAKALELKPYNKKIQRMAYSHADLGRYAARLEDVTDHKRMGIPCLNLCLKSISNSHHTRRRN
jgi:hypothetical protein